MSGALRTHISFGVSVGKLLPNFCRRLLREQHMYELICMLEHKESF